jgi:hypothetical protein
MEILESRSMTDYFEPTEKSANTNAVFVEPISERMVGEVLTPKDSTKPRPKVNKNNLAIAGVLFVATVGALYLLKNLKNRI